MKDRQKETISKEKERDEFGTEHYSTYIFILKEYFVYFVKLKNCLDSCLEERHIPNSVKIQTAKGGTWNTRISKENEKKEQKGENIKKRRR